MKGTPVRCICVFAGSSSGARAEYAEAAQALGREMARRGLGLVYGGARRGLMGALADAALAEGGEVIGVIPRGLFQREVAHHGLTTLHEVASMHERKALMSDLADGFIALPGGYGTFDELFEIVTWAQLGIHTKPIGLLDVREYFAPLLTLIERATQEGFVPPAHATPLLRAESPNELLDRLASFHSATTSASVEPLPER
jgi:uncharacterized protein (TIGR00730 family)